MGGYNLFIKDVISCHMAECHSLHICCRKLKSIEQFLNKYELKDTSSADESSLFYDVNLDHTLTFKTKICPR